MLYSGRKSDRWYKPSIPALQSRNRQFSDLEASLLNKASFRPESQDQTVRLCNENVEEVL